VITTTWLRRLYDESWRYFVAKLDPYILVIADSLQLRLGPYLAASIDQARDLLERFLNDIEFHADRDDLHSRASRYLLAQVYLALHQFSKAELCFRKIIDRATQGLGEDWAHLVTFEAWRMLAVIANFYDRFEERNAFEQKALECGQMTYGPWHLRVIQLQREVFALEPRTAAGKQWRYISSFPAFEDETIVEVHTSGIL
jgi:tetratricopeptide (TPR) repeat protein